MCLTIVIMVFNIKKQQNKNPFQQEQMFVPFPLRLQSNQAGYTCITKALPIPSSKSEIQQISVSTNRY